MLVLKSSLWSINIIAYCLHTVALKYSLNRHTEYVQQVISIYEKQTVQLATVGLAQAHPNSDVAPSNPLSPPPIPVVLFKFKNLVAKQHFTANPYGCL